jgi:NAD-dependent SIR2 family protein deacetylase
MNEAGLDPAALDAAARLAGEADALLVCAGAGMGVDSGLPDFRGDAGFNWGERLPHGVRVFTSNVDGQFQRAGFDGVVEAHGSIHDLQCLRPCSDDVWPAAGVEVEVDEDTMRAVPPLPRCRHCGGLARPNILMFMDWTWMGKPADAQEHELERWRANWPAPRPAWRSSSLGPARPFRRCG